MFNVTYADNSKASKVHNEINKENKTQRNRKNRRKWWKPMLQWKTKESWGKMIMEQNSQSTK